MGTTAVEQSVLETNILITTETVDSALILDDQWQVACILIPDDRVADFFIDSGSIVPDTFNILSRNDFGTIVKDALLDGVNTFYNQSGDATLAYIVFTAPGDWGTATVGDLITTLTPIAEIIQDKTNIVFPAIEVQVDYDLTSDAIDTIALSFDFFTLKIDPVPADVAGVDTLNTYMVTNLKTSIVLNNTITMLGRPDFAGAAGGLQTAESSRGDTLVVGHTWQGNPVVGVAPTFVEPSGTVFDAIQLSALSFLQRETPDADTVVYMGGWAYGGYTTRTPLSFLIFNTYARIQLRNNVLPLLTRKETRPVTSDDVNAVGSIMGAILDPFVNSIIETNSLIIKSFTPTEIQDAIQSGTLVLVLSKMIKYTLPKVVQEVTISIVAEAA